MKGNLRTILFAIPYFLLSSTSFAQAISVKDSLALVDFFDSTGGEQWTHRGNWKSDMPVKYWNGVTIELDRVIRITLNDNGVSGKFPYSFGNLDSLKSIVFIQNYLFGVIPSSFENLTALTQIRIDGGALNGGLDVLSKMSWLTTLSLSWQSLSCEIPLSLKNLKNLNDLEFLENSISGNPKFLGDLSIQYLDLGGNRFTFEGIEQLVQAYNTKGPDYNVYYERQDSIPMYQLGGKMWVSAGGTLANNTYNWYKVGYGLVATIIGDSTYAPASAGIYYVQVTNSIATNLTLASKKAAANSINIFLCPGIDSFKLYADGPGISYKWQRSQDGYNFYDLTNDMYHTGVYDSVLNLINIPTSWYGYYYRCILNGYTSTPYNIHFLNQWVGNVNTNWENIANWSCGKLPDENTDVIIHSGTIVLNSSFTISTLQLLPGANFTIKPGVTLTITH